MSFTRLIGVEPIMQDVLKNRIKIEKRTVERVVSYGVPQNGKGNEFLIYNHEIRALAL